MMQKLKEEITAAANRELNRANEQFPLFTSKHRRAARERRERKKYFAMQKLNGVALLIFTAVAIKILEGDATIAFITVPLGLSMLLSKEMLIINKYYWKCEEKAERGVQ